MKISSKNWKAYTAKLAAINQKASDAMRTYVDVHGYDDFYNVIAYGYSLTSKYGEAAGELACEMYDALARAQNAKVKAAIPAKTASLKKVAGTLNGASHTINGIPSAVGRMVKQVGADTMVQNAKRGGAEFAWIASGDACAFCEMVASNGWVHAAQDTSTYADHIHNNCQCEFAVRFDGESDVDGYDPEGLYNMFVDTGETSWDDRVKAVQAQHDAENRDAINARKRAEYAARQEKKEE